MHDPAVNAAWRPTTPEDRYVSLDTLRGLALLGVLLVNLHVGFRVCLAEYLLEPHADWDRIDTAADIAIIALFEFKAFAIFSLLFGAGLAVFADRSAAREVAPGRFLIRRLAVLLGFGLCHLLLIWNGDILTLYAVGGFLLVPLLRLPAAGLAAVGVAALMVSTYIPWGFVFPSEEALRVLAKEATHAYTRGSFQDVIAFQWRETRLLILPLLVTALPKTFGLMAIGAAAWKAGVVRNPNEHGRALWVVALVGCGVGGAATVLRLYSARTGSEPDISPQLLEIGSAVLLALGYSSAVLLALRSPWVARAATPFAAVGRMALTNYLTQSVALSFLFYGYGIGLFNRLGPAAAAGVGLSLYATQVGVSLIWLRRFRFGPVEWLWRTLTYGHWQPMRRSPGAGTT